MDPRWMRETPTEPIITQRYVEPRRALRRALELRCDVVSHYWDDVVSFRMTDVSPYGAFIDTLFPLHRGAEVVLCFTPPRGPLVTVFAEVARAVTGRLRRDRKPLGMGMAFTGVSDDDRAALADRLRGIPPRKHWAPSSPLGELSWPNVGQSLTLEPCSS